MTDILETVIAKAEAVNSVAGFVDPLDEALAEFEAQWVDPDLRVGDLTPDADDLILLYGDAGEHPFFTKADWRAEVAEELTLLGYWERVEEYLYNKADELVSED